MSPRKTENHRPYLSPSLLEAQGVTDHASGRSTRPAPTFLALIPLVILATIVDWIIIHNHWGIFPWYHIGGWLVVWLIVFFLLKRRWLKSIGTILLMSVAEDVLYLSYASLIGEREFYPLYCHDWLWGCQNWLGMPSYYFIAVLGGILLCRL